MVKALVFGTKDLCVRIAPWSREWSFFLVEYYTVVLCGHEERFKNTFVEAHEIQRLLLCKFTMHNDHGPNSATGDLGQLHATEL